ncbi:hypothetical protein V8F20_008063 [Naviculisporaceae sp. PSN 640]
MTDFRVWRLGRPYCFEKDDEIEQEDQQENTSLALVDEKDYQPKGKFHSVVYLDIITKYRDEKTKEPWHEYSSASGWLIEENIVVTAGHCVWGRKRDGVLAKVVTIFARFGYKRYIGEPDERPLTPVDEKGISKMNRYAYLIVAPTKWCSDYEAAYDIAFIRLGDPLLDGLEPLEYTDTPENSKLGPDHEILVVGYPGSGNNGGTSVGGKMCFSKARRDSSGPEAKQDPSLGHLRNKLILLGHSSSESNASPGGKLLVIGTHTGGDRAGKRLDSTVIGKRGDVEIVYSHYTELLTYVAADMEKRSSKAGTVYRRQNDGSYEALN